MCHPIMHVVKLPIPRGMVPKIKPRTLIYGVGKFKTKLRKPRSLIFGLEKFILFQQLDCFCLLGCFCRLLMLMRFGLTRVGCYCRILRASYILCLVATEMTQLLENYFSELNTLFIIASCRSQAAD